MIRFPIKGFFRYPDLHAMRGFSLISAIFLLVILAGLGAAMVAISTVQHTSSALDVQGARAYQAARTGIEWGLFQKLRTTGYCNGVDTRNIVLPAGTSLSGFTVTVICTPNTFLTIPTAVIEATACNIPTGAGTCPNQTSNNIDYVQRRVQINL